MSMDGDELEGRIWDDFLNKASNSKAHKYFSKLLVKLGHMKTAVRCRDAVCQRKHIVVMEVETAIRKPRGTVA